MTEIDKATIARVIDSDTTEALERLFMGRDPFNGFYRDRVAEILAPCIAKLTAQPQEGSK